MNELLFILRQVHPTSSDALIGMCLIIAAGFAVVARMGFRRH